MWTTTDCLTVRKIRHRAEADTEERKSKFTQIYQKKKAKPQRSILNRYGLVINPKALQELEKYILAKKLNFATKEIPRENIICVTEAFVRRRSKENQINYTVNREIHRSVHINSIKRKKENHYRIQEG
ncbi:hypothetical protein Trydic_g23216 [Trypoxylus dichotomus]